MTLDLTRYLPAPLDDPAAALQSTVWCAYDDSDSDAWDRNAMYVDLDHAKRQAITDFIDVNLAVDHADHRRDDPEIDADTASADCPACQPRRTEYLRWLSWKPLDRMSWQLWAYGDRADRWTGITIRPAHLLWPAAQPLEASVV